MPAEYFLYSCHITPLKTLLMHQGFATTSGERKKRPHNTAELASTEKRKFSAPSMQYGKQRYHQVTFKVCALRARPIKSSAKHHHCAITLLPAINCRSHSKAGTSYFHSPATLGMQHVSALLLSTLSEALQLHSSKLCPSGHQGHHSAAATGLTELQVPEFGTAGTRVKVSGVPQNQFSLLIYIKCTNWHRDSGNPHFHLQRQLQTAQKNTNQDVLRSCSSHCKC